MIEINVRRLIVYGATGVFFLMAAMGQLQGASLSDTFLKAGAGCVVVVILGLPIVRIVEGAAVRSAQAGTKRASSAATPAPAPPAGAEATANEAIGARSA